MNAFNEYGKPSSELIKFEKEFEASIRGFFMKMVDKGCSATEIRAITGYLSGNVNIAGSEAILYLAQEIKRNKVAKADKNLNDQEMLFIRQGKKIQAIKEYRDRTGLGLGESKEAIEKWMGKIDWTENYD